MAKVQTLIMDTFPDFNEPGFDIERYNQRFYNSNVVIRASARAVEYPLHWCPLSIKCSFKGEEHYQTKQTRYAVDDDHFLVFNNGQMYSSWIDSPTLVDSVTLNIAPAFEQLAVRSVHSTADQLLDEPLSNNVTHFHFTERIYQHGPLVSAVARKIMAAKDPSVLDRLFYKLMEDLLSIQAGNNNEMKRIDKVRPSVKAEIYERLLHAKDYIHSCYRNDLLLDDMARVACMNPFYFLRQFRKTFSITPHQFLIRRRMQVAATLLRTTDQPVTEVCHNVGFNDPSSFGKLFRRHYGFSPAGRRMYVKS